MGNLPQVKNTALKRLSQRRRDAQLTKSLKESRKIFFQNVAHWQKNTKVIYGFKNQGVYCIRKFSVSRHFFKTNMF